jgi:hypothetical protein
MPRPDPRYASARVGATRGDDVAIILANHSAAGFGFVGPR